MTRPPDPSSDQPSAERDELASAYLDGQATPEESARVEADPGLLARVAELRAVAAAVAAPVEPPDTNARDAAITAALAAAAEWSAPPAATSPAVDLEAERTRRAGQRRRLWAVSVAAALLAALVAVPLLASLRSDDGDDDTATAAGEADQAEPSATEESDSGSDTAAPPDTTATFTESAEDDGIPTIAIGSFVTEAELVDAVRQTQASSALGPAVSSTLPAAGSAQPPCPSPLAPTDEITGRYQAILDNAPVTVYAYRVGASGLRMIVLDATCDPLLETDL